MFIVVFGPCFVVQYLVSFISLREREREREREKERERERERADMTTQVHIICTSLNLSLNFKHRFETLKPRFENFNLKEKVQINYSN